MRTVLIVEDSDNLALFTARSIETMRKGVKVLVASDCSEARRLALSRQPDLLLIDVTLPDGNGLELAEELHRQMPRARFVLMSGHPLDPGSHLPFAFLNKPFDHAELELVLGEPGEPGEPATCSSGQLLCPTCTNSITLSNEDLHWIYNRLSAIMSGLKAFGLELNKDAQDPKAVVGYADEYVNRLCAIVRGLSDRLKDEARK